MEKLEERRESLTGQRESGRVWCSDGREALPRGVVISCYEVTGDEDRTLATGSGKMNASDLERSGPRGVVRTMASLEEVKERMVVRIRREACGNSSEEQL